MTFLGFVLLLLGILLLFDTALLVLGNILFLSGITLLIGPANTFLFFTRRQKLRGSIVFFTGIFLVLIKWAKIGICLEIFGILNLFGNFFPIVFGILRNFPVIGPVLSHPIVRKLMDRLLGATLPSAA